MMEIARQWVFSQIGGISPRSGNIHDIHNLTHSWVGNCPLFQVHKEENAYLRSTNDHILDTPHQGLKASINCVVKCIRIQTMQLNLCHHDCPR